MLTVKINATCLKLMLPYSGYIGNELNEADSSQLEVFF